MLRGSVLLWRTGYRFGCRLDLYCRLVVYYDVMCPTSKQMRHRANFGVCMSFTQWESDNSLSVSPVDDMISFLTAK